MTPTFRELVLAMGSSLPVSVITKATVIAAFGLVGARLARRSRAAVRHVLLAATFGVLMLLPVASLVAPPIQIAVRTAGQESPVLLPAAAGADSTSSLSPAATQPVTIPDISRLLIPSLSTLLLFTWFAGFALSLIPLIMGLGKIRALRRTGLPWMVGKALVDGLAVEAGISRCVEVLLHESLPGPVASGALHPAILLPENAESWEREDLRRALVHELEHVRRGDVVIHSLARVVCSLYWFHPLAWMAWRQLVVEAERACDDAVIARSEATAYAEQLVALARKLLASEKSPLLAMASRSDLAVRVGAVLDTRQRRGRAGALIVGLGCAAALVALTISPLSTISAPQPAGAQAAKASTTPFPAFEVASIKPNPGCENKGPAATPRTFTPSPDRLVMPCVSLGRLIQTAYGTFRDGVTVDAQPLHMEGVASWMQSEFYSVSAKAAAPPARPQMMEGPMLQVLLEERFRLKVHYEAREMPVFAMTVGKTGLKIQPVAEGACTPLDLVHLPKQGAPTNLCGVLMLRRTEAGTMRIDVSGSTMAHFAKQLSLLVGRTVIDKTGIAGQFNFHLEYTPDLGMPSMGSPGPRPPEADNAANPGAQPPPLGAGPSIFVALPEKLGLKLKSTKGPVSVLVIDHAERPTAN